MILPNGRCDVIFRFNVLDHHKPVPVVTGPATQPYVVEYDAGDRWLGMRLRHGNGAALWQDQISYATDHVLRGEDAIALFPQLAGLQRAQMTQSHLEQALGTHHAPPVDSRLIRALDALHLSGGRMKNDRLALYAGCSARHLNRLFISHIGLNTKVYAQLVQFHRALKLIRHAHLTLSDAAFESGYADQAHLTRAFRRYGGFKPSAIPAQLSLPTLPI